MEQGRQQNHPRGVSMDNDSSVESFSFALPVNNFSEFDGVTSKRPVADPSKDTPADVLFHNGRLLPHAYNSPSYKDSGSDHSRLSSSRTSSTNSKSSASRSNSGSSSSSGRISSSSGARARVRRAKSEGIEQHQSATLPSRSRKVVPPLESTAELSFRHRNASPIHDPKLKKAANKSESHSWFGMKIFNSFTTACRECHALEPSAVEQGAIQGNIKSR